MEERKIFDKQFVHFMWDDSLEGKEGIFADYIDRLVDRVEDGKGKLRCKGPGSSDYPFSVDCDYCFFYYDPLYDIKLAWKQGKQIQYRLEGSCDWIDCTYPQWNDWQEYRVKPEEHKLVFASNGCLSLDTEGVIYILCTGTKEQCLKYALDNWCSRCVKFKTCSPDDVCRGYEKNEPKKKKWRPFKNIQELKQTWDIKRGPLVHPELEEPTVWVRSKSNTSSTYLITHFCGNMGVVYLCGYLNTGLEQLFDDYTFLDGTPIGVACDE